MAASTNTKTKAKAKARAPLPKVQARDKGSVPRSPTERLWLIGGGLVAFIVILIGYFFFISPQRANTADINGQVTATKEQNAVLQGRIDALREQSKNLDKYEQELATARLALPSTSGVPDFLRSLQSLGNLTHTDVTALSVGEPTAVTALGGVQPGATTTPTATPTATPTVPAGTSPVAVLYSLTINATVSGSPSALVQFLDQLQTVQPRAVLISSITESAPTTTSGQRTSSDSSLQLTMEAFVAPDPSAVAAAAQPTATATS